MNPCRLSVLLASVALFGFAPAPFPRPQRAPKVDDLERLQGVWRMTYQESSGVASSHDYKVRVRGDRWTFVHLSGDRESDATGYFLRLDQTVLPRAMEWANDKAGTSGWVASYRLEGRRLTVVYESGTLAKDLATRPTSFEGRVPHKMTFEFVGR